MTECVDELLDGYYVSNETTKTIDKCDEKCKTCSTESMKNNKNLCTSCNNNANFYQISDDLSKEYFECYNTITQKYYLKDNIYYPCYNSCLICTEGGDETDHKCFTCEEGYWEYGTNCYKECSYCST